MDPDDFPTLDPQLADLLRALPDMGASLEDVPAARAMMRSFVPAEQSYPGEKLLEIADQLVPGLPGSPDVAVRVYKPLDTGSDPLPGLLYLHGGGFCLGDVDIEHGAAVALAVALRVVLVSVDYRLAPEHPYPAGLDDCHTALRWLADRSDVDPARIAVHGQSAGGGLAAAVALVARDRGGPSLCFQSLGIPELDDRLDTPSMRNDAAMPLWSRAQGLKSWEHYLGGRPADGYAAPARMDDLSGLPPAYVVTCELDPLRDEGLTYAMRLLQAGVSVEQHTFPGCFHGTAIVQTADVVKRMDAELVGVLRRALS